MLTRVAALSGLCLTFGCATVPDDAPQEFHDAKASIDEMENVDADDQFPKSAERATAAFDDALEMLDDAKSDEPEVTEGQAISKASEAKQTADGIVRMHSEILAWDDSSNALQGALAALDSAENPVVVEGVAIVSPFANLQGSEIVSTVAYFPTNVADEANVNDAEMSALLNILGKSDSYQVVLTGYADPRGDESYNEKLALRRAQTVARSLVDNGATEQQIVVQSAGESKAKGEEGNAAELQLDRKVQATLILR